jgi:hypothetical protein
MFGSYLLLDLGNGGSRPAHHSEDIGSICGSECLTVLWNQVVE